MTSTEGCVHVGLGLKTLQCALDTRSALDWSFSPVGDVAIGVALTAVLNQLVNSAPTSP
jgi:hypothetical protein